MCDYSAGELIRERLRHNKIKVIWVLPENVRSLNSPHFSDTQNNSWCLRVADNDRGWPRVTRSLDLTPKTCYRPVTGYCKFSILDADRKEVKVQTKYFRNCPNGSPIRLVDSITGSLGENKLKVEGRLRIIFQIAVIEFYDPSANLIDTDGLSRELEDLFTSERFSDIIICAGGREFKVHRTILAARSPVFSAMFSSKLEESTSGRAELADVSAEVLEEMLKFMYTGKSVLVDQMYHDKEKQGINQNLAIGLLEVADKYQLDKLKVICEDALADSLTGGSVHNIVALSCLHRADSLKHQCIEFISTHTNEFIERLIASGGFIKEALALILAVADG